MVNRKVVMAVVLIAVTYFPTAYYLRDSYVKDVPQRGNLVLITRVMPTATPGTFYAHLWLPNRVTGVTVYENGVSIGAANSVHDDTARKYSFDGKRWKFVEFNTDGKRIRRWITFAE